MEQVLDIYVAVAYVAWVLLFSCPEDDIVLVCFGTNYPNFHKV